MKLLPLLKFLSQHLFAFFPHSSFVRFRRQKNAHYICRKALQFWWHKQHQSINYISPWSLIHQHMAYCIWPLTCAHAGVSQLAKPNPIYYLWRDINSGECDPLQLNGLLKPSIILSSIYGRKFMWLMGCNVIYVKNAYLWHTLPVSCLWSLINKAVIGMEMIWEKRGGGVFFGFSSSLLLIPLHTTSAI